MQKTKNIVQLLRAEPACNNISRCSARISVQLTVTFLSIVLLTACMFDKHYLLDQKFPATLDLVNNTGKTIYIKSIYSAVEAKDAFVFDSIRIKSNMTHVVKISWSMYDDMLNGNMIIEGKCSDSDESDRPLKVEPTSSKEGHVLLRFVDC